MSLKRHIDILIYVYEPDNIEIIVINSKIIKLKQFFLFIFFFIEIQTV